MKSSILTLSGFVLAMTMVCAPFTVDAGMHGGSNGSGGSGSSGGQGSGGQGSGGHGSGDQGTDGQHQGMSNNGGSEFRAQRILESLDLDGSGDLSLDEFLARPTGSGPDHFDRMDTDDDGLVSEDEYLGAQGANFSGMNIDFDALHTCIEEQGGSEWMSPPDRETRFVEMDANADGYIDLDEFEMAKDDRAVERFMLIDTNEDGAVSESELTDVLGEMGQHHSIRRECIDEQRDLNSLQGG